MKQTISFDETVEGWTSFYSFIPDWMTRMSNNFFTMKDGQLFLHHDESVPRNNFYGEQYKSKLKFAVNDAPSEIKVFKSLGIEGNKSWEVVIKAFQSDSQNFAESSIKDVEFVKKEGYWYAHVRRNELVTDLSAKSTFGVGVLLTRDESSFTIGTISTVIAEGDIIFTEDAIELGTVLEVRGTTIILDTVIPNMEGKFLYGVKDARTEGAEMRGYTAVVEMEVDSPDKLELYAVNSEVFKSHR